MGPASSSAGPVSPVSAGLVGPVSVGVKRSAENLRTLGIYEYLKSNNEAFRIEEQGSNENLEQEYEFLYSKINQWYKTNSLDQTFV